MTSPSLGPAPDTQRDVCTTIKVAAGSQLYIISCKSSWSRLSSMLHSPSQSRGLATSESQATPRGSALLFTLWVAKHVLYWRLQLSQLQVEDKVALMVAPQCLFKNASSNSGEASPVTGPIEFLRLQKEVQQTLFSYCFSRLFAFGIFQDIFFRRTPALTS